jgi:diguanylate cyclase (GGDEF)-like protein
MWALRSWLNRSIRTKMLLALTSLACFGLMVLLALLQPAIVSRFDVQERAQLEHDTRRSAAMIGTEAAALSRVGINFAVWNDAYEYVRRPSPTFETSNYVPGTFEGLQANLMMYVRLNGQLISARSYGLERHRAENPDAGLVAALTSPALLAGLGDPAAHREGLLTLPPDRRLTRTDLTRTDAEKLVPPGTWLVAARPVTTNEGKGPVSGVLILARRIDARTVQQFRTNTQLNLRLQPLTPTSTARPSTARPSTTRSGQMAALQVAVSLHGEERISGQLPLPGLDGRPSLLLEVTNERVSHRLGVVTAWAVLLATGAVMLIFTVATLLLLNVLVLSRLAVYQQRVRRLGLFRGPPGQTLHDAVAALSLSHEQPLSQGHPHMAEAPLLAQRLPVHAPDELGDLGNAFNSFIEEMASGRERLLWQAHHDHLTGLPNRQLLASQITARLLRGAPLSVALLDLNRFKNINDTLGHQVGDEVLEVVAQRLVTALPHDSLVARLGGDEFAVLLPVPPERAQARLERAMRDLTQPIRTGAGEVRVGGSVGLTGSPGGSADTSAPDLDWVALMRQADVAMYRAKRDGLTVCQFSPALLEAVEERARLEDALETAIERGELRMVYQPVVQLTGPPRMTGDSEVNQLSGHLMVGVEALIRWRHPQLGEIAPNRFIPLAEENGQVRVLGAWVLDAALKFARQMPGLRVAVNVSAAQLGEADFVEGVMQALAKHGVAPDQLELEVTETTVLRDLTHATQQLAALHALGVWITLDDFGTGHSSLAVLYTLPIQKVKLDRLFLVGSLQSPRSEGVLRAVLDMAQGLNLEVVAEGIETAEQRGTLQRLGCPLGQGYLFARPMEEDAALAAFSVDSLPRQNVL